MMSKTATSDMDPARRLAAVSWELFGMLGVAKDRLKHMGTYPELSMLLPVLRAHIQDIERCIDLAGENAHDDALMLDTEAHDRLRRLVRP